MIRITDKSKLKVVSATISTIRRGSAAELARAMAEMYNPTRLGPGFYRRVAEKLARRFVVLVHDQLRQGRFVRNTPITVALKQSDRPLIDTYKLTKSIIVQKAGPSAFRVTFRGLAAGSRLPMAALAARLDQGAPGYQMTEKQQGWFWAKVIEGALPRAYAGWVAKGRVKKLRPRPFFSRAMNNLRKEVTKLIGDSIPKAVISTSLKFSPYRRSGRRG